MLLLNPTQIQSLQIWLGHNKGHWADQCTESVYSCIYYFNMCMRTEKKGEKSVMAIFLIFYEHTCWIPEIFFEKFYLLKKYESCSDEHPAPHVVTGAQEVQTRVFLSRKEIQGSQQVSCFVSIVFIGNKVEMGHNKGNDTKKIYRRILWENEFNK